VELIGGANMIFFITFYGIKVVVGIIVLTYVNRLLIIKEKE